MRHCVRQHGIADDEPYDYGELNLLRSARTRRGDGDIRQALSSGGVDGNPGGVLEANDNFDSVLVVFIGPQADCGNLRQSL
jgi:hypothetical protein